MFSFSQKCRNILCLRARNFFPAPSAPENTPIYPYFHYLLHFKLQFSRYIYQGHPKNFGKLVDVFFLQKLGLISREILPGNSREIYKKSFPVSREKSLRIPGNFQNKCKLSFSILFIEIEELKSETR